MSKWLQLVSSNKLISIAFISELWSLYPNQVEDNEETTKSVLQMLKRANRDKFRPLRVIISN
jgi:hypothetical protein